MNSTAVSDLASHTQTSRGARLSWWERASFTVSHTAASLLLALLTVRGFYHFGRLFGTLEWLINYKRRRRVGTVLETVLGRDVPTSRRRRAVRENFMQTRCDKLFYLVFDRIPREQLVSLLSIGNKQLLDDAVARGCGVYMAMSHHGALHVIAMLLALADYKTAGVRDLREGAMRRFVQERFDRLYPEFQRMRVLFAHSYPREIYRCLKDGYMLGSAMDAGRLRGEHQRIEVVRVFGQERGFLSGPMRIAIRCRAPVLQAFVVPERNFRYRLEIVEQLIDPEQVGEEDAAIERAMQTYARNVETHARSRPSLVTRI